MDCLTRSFALGLLALTACTSEPPPPGPAPELILYNGTIYTQDEGKVVSAIALQDGRVLTTGTDQEIQGLAVGRTQSIDLQGKFVYPGFADAHAHIVGVGNAAENLDLVGTTSYEGIVARAVAHAEDMPEGEWLLGRGWDQNDWMDTEFPNHLLLSEAFPDRPVVLIRVDGHALLANAAAMQAAGVGPKTKDPEGGRIWRFTSGELTGVFVDRAEDLIVRATPGKTRAQVRRQIQSATVLFHEQGITAVHDAGIGRGTLNVFRDLAEEDVLQLRMHAMLDGSDANLLKDYFRQGPEPDVAGNGRLAIRSLKLFSDGALGSRGAALLEPYTDADYHSGLVLTPASAIEDIAGRAAAARFQVCPHAIGDRGVRNVLDAYATGMTKAAQPDDTRFRVEHAQVIHADDLPRFAELGVIPSMQAQHQTSDMPWAEARVGADRILGAYAWRSLRETGCIIPGGSDAPVERLDVVAQFAAAVSRQTLDGQPDGGWYPDQVLSRQEALDMLTIWPAFAAFREHDLGRLASGYRADLVVFEGDLMTTPADQLKNCRPVMTVFDGEVVWQR